MLEEAMNTLEEEQTMAEYMGITIEKMREKYSSLFCSSAYQGYLSRCCRAYAKKITKRRF